MYVYKITNLINNKIYIGMTKDYKERFKQHLHYKKFKKEKDKPLYKAFEKFGIENFKFEIIEEVESLELAKEREIYYISYFDSTNDEKGYNLNKGGDYRSNFGENNNTTILTEEEVKYIRSQKDKGYKLGNVYKEFCDRISYSGFQSIWLGRTWKHIESSKTKGVCGASLDSIIVNKIKEDYKNGLTISQIAKKHNINYKKCWRICTNQTYKETL